MSAQDVTSARDPINVRSVLSMRGAVVRVGLKGNDAIVGTVKALDHHTLLITPVGLVKPVEVDMRRVTTASAAQLTFEQTTRIAKKQRARFATESDR